MVEPRSSTYNSPVAAEHPGVQLGHEGVVGERHPAAAGPPDRHLVAERELLTPALGGVDDDQALPAPAPPVRGGWPGRSRLDRGRRGRDGVGTGAGLGSRNSTHTARRTRRKNR